MKTPSTALYRMMSELLGIFKLKFPPLTDEQDHSFPVLKGCDDYIARLAKLKLDSENYLKTTLVTADFGDAYTETCISHVQNSISNIGKIIGIDVEKIMLMRKLVQLVFSNCYFFTPSGLFRQTRGMPMGDVSSRDALDLDLTNSEFQILSSLSSISLNIHLYCRLVDDISVVVQGNFRGVRDLLDLMVLHYPNMPLNFQISFGYSRFLDLHIYNICKHNTQKSKYQLVHSLAYKEHSTFSYTSMHSNIHSRYKHAVVPISLYRAHTRCTESEDINHHIGFMSKILKHRNQDPEQVLEKTRNFFKKRMKIRPHKKLVDFKKTTAVTFDSVTGSHVFIQKVLRNSFKSRLRIVYKSKPSLGSILCPKRRIIRKLSQIAGRPGITK